MLKKKKGTVLPSPATPSHPSPALCHPSGVIAGRLRTQVSTSFLNYSLYPRPCESPPMATFTSPKKPTAFPSSTTSSSYPPPLCLPRGSRHTLHSTTATPCKHLFPTMHQSQSCFFPFRCVSLGAYACLRMMGSGWMTFPWALGRSLITSINTHASVRATSSRSTGGRIHSIRPPPRLPSS